MKENSVVLKAWIFFTNLPNQFIIHGHLGLYFLLISFIVSGYPCSFHIYLDNGSSKRVEIWLEEDGDADAEAFLPRRHKLQQHTLFT
ncbi:hypothetical protein RJT34_30148 [Clitoria ternatea]|uniref:Uncharacterized protein n=1 Tax=Clitoria ternatea TaxID=43366 RepID=A0AAN9ERU6_CLITE